MKKLIVTLAVCLFAFAAFELRAQTQNLPTLTSAQYASMKKDDVYVIMFTSETCPPCKLAKRTIFPALVKKYASEPNVHVYLFSMDTDVPASDGTLLTGRLGISTIPAFVVLYNDTDYLSDSAPISGYAPSMRKELEDKISSAVSKVK